ncbi:hypothetical protein COY28_06360 [Candidatus Woesearchaeota archaeon CG_4_10_14_0_2_um_filter_57_5]|nr:MAG: hypothetical protein AUJ68_05175 [Candidatus Woesearchaeota archaeon CG1_02_57_44]PIN69996.1 MAG: hypothetical protein COV94_02235 [Candidatus Woesearchaeota archaeon CG11_big_fil_rev_8_21_14_0_20_57_5]PIZ49430.1 MAG: hypothetical protein COY28_06360 [Candidatus Woesearchaeota archaeon CG_4_10_14_0_2_um_filter_57_5]
MNKDEFIDLWAEYVRTHDDKDWSRQQNVIINSCIRTSTMTREQYLRMKQEGEFAVKKEASVDEKQQE